MATIHVNPYQKTIPQGIVFVSMYTGIILGIPCLLFYCAAITAITISSGLTPINIFLLLVTDGVLFLLIAWYILHSQKNKRDINRILKAIKCQEFNPLPDDEAFELQHSAYLGIDTRKGSIVYITRLNRHGFRPYKEVLVMGFDMNNISGYEFSGKKFTIHTRDVDIPKIVFTSQKAQTFFDKLNIMRRQPFDYPYDVPGYVEYKAEQVTGEMGIDLVVPHR